MEFWKPKILLVSRPTLQIRQNRYMWDGYKTTAKRSTVSSTTSASTTAHCRRGRWHSSINSAPPGFVTYGRTLEEAKRMAREGLEFHCECEFLEHVGVSRRSLQRVAVA